MFFFLFLLPSKQELYVGEDFGRKLCPDMGVTCRDKPGVEHITEETWLRGILYSFHERQCNVGTLSWKRLTANLFSYVVLKVVACHGEYVETQLMNSSPKSNFWMETPP